MFMEKKLKKNEEEKNSTQKKEKKGNQKNASKPREKQEAKAKNVKEQQKKEEILEEETGEEIITPEDPIINENNVSNNLVFLEKLKSPKAKKAIIISCIAIAILVVGGILFKVAILPSIYYNKAAENFDKKNYEQAVKYYSKNPEYKDTKKKLDVAYFEYAKQLIEKGKYAEALKNLSLTNNKEKENYVSYAQAEKNVEEKNFDDAIEAFFELGDFLNSEEELNRAYYLKAEDLLENKKYKDAIDNYKKAKKYEDSENKINVCNFLLAEENYQAGKLYDAQKKFKKLPKDFEYNGLKVSERLDTLEKYKSFVDLSGTWKGSKGKYEVRQIWKYDGSWESWYNSFSSSFEITCVIKGDGSVKVSGNPTFYSYVNYSTLGYAVNEKEFDAPIDFTVKKGKKIPSKLVSSYPSAFAPDGTVGKTTLTYSSGKIKLSFTLNDTAYSQDFTNKYTSKITFKKVK